MSRRAGSHRDRIGRRADAELGLAQLVEVLDTVGELESAIVRLRIGLLDDEPLTYDEIGQIYGVTRERARWIESKAISRLRHPARSQVLRDYLDEDIAQLPDHVRARILGQAAPAPMAHCERHGWFRTSPARPTCGSCPCPLPAQWTGRPASYCSPACRQAAYRRRKTAANNRRGTGPRRTTARA